MKRKKNKKWWDADKVSLLRKLWKEGKNDTEIGAIFGVSAGSVHGARERNGLTRTAPIPLSDEEKQAIRTLAPTHTQAEIAEILHRSRPAVREYINKNHIAVKRRSGVVAADEQIDENGEGCEGLFREYTYNTDVLIMQFLTEGYAVNYIANMLGRNIESLQDYIKHNKSRLMRAHQNMMNYNGVYAHRCNKKRKEY